MGDVGGSSPQARHAAEARRSLANSESVLFFESRSLIDTVSWKDREHFPGENHRRPKSGLITDKKNCRSKIMYLLLNHNILLRMNDPIKSTLYDGSSMTLRNSSSIFTKPCGSTSFGNGNFSDPRRHTRSVRHPTHLEILPHQPKPENRTIPSEEPRRFDHLRALEDSRSRPGTCELDVDPIKPGLSAELSPTIRPRDPSYSNHKTQVTSVNRGCHGSRRSVSLRMKLECIGQFPWYPFYARIVRAAACESGRFGATRISVS